MALRDQPYFPLYVDDYLTDEKLNMCAPASQGIYIKILCIMHKSEHYGCILLKQKDKQVENVCLNFARKLARLLPFTVDEINSAISDLIDENVLYLDGDMLCQKRMIKDNSISISRAKAGTKGGETTQKRIKKFAKPKDEANSVNEDEDVNENIDSNVLNKKGKENAPRIYFDNQELNDVFTKWLKMLHERKKPMAQSSIEALQMKLNYQNVERSIKQVTQSLEKGWLNLRQVEESESKLTKEQEEEIDIAILKNARNVRFENNDIEPSEDNRLRRLP